MPTCKNCQQNFQITDADREFYNKIDVPEPTHCPDCRQQRRLVWRNERKWYPEKCDLCQKAMVSLYSSDKPYLVYCQECWWGDNWDPLQYGQDYDFSRPFFEQYQELQLKVPRLALFNLESINSTYTNHSSNNKNCYVGVAFGGCEDCLYGHWLVKSKDVVDSLYCEQCELCYEVSYCNNCYQIFFSEYCLGSRDCWLCFECQNCEFCIGCTQLRHKKYYILNKQVSKDEFESVKKEILSSPTKFKEILKLFSALKLKSPRRYMHQLHCYNSTGDDLYSCKNSHFCFNTRNLEDCKYMFDLGNNKDSMDCYEHGWLVPSQLNYEAHAGMAGFNFKFCQLCSDSRDLSYCDLCMSNCWTLFGCISLKHKQHCILNKQYTEEEYNKLVPKIITQMKKDGEYGEFFSIRFSPFGYNETPAQEYFPLTKEEALAKGYKWKDKDKRDYQKQTYQMPADIKDIPESIIQEILACVDCGKNYKIVTKELDFYKNFNLSIPKKCPDCRHLDRAKLRNPRQLWDRKCDKCGEDIKTTYSPDRPEIVYCEECYQKEIY